MQVIPAIDLREGACVQLVGGSYADERVRVADPQSVAKSWADLGFCRLHVVDLDAATGRGSNREIVRSILAACTTEPALEPTRRGNSAEGSEPMTTVQCGGGVRDLETIGELLDAGASAVVIGTRAIEDRAWLEEAVARYPNRIIVAADSRARRILTSGWSRTDARDVVDFVAELSSLPLAAILVTAVEREGRMEGPDLKLMRDIAPRSQSPIHASGGVRDANDIRALADAGVSAAIVGMALYTGVLDPYTILEEFRA